MIAIVNVSPAPSIDVTVLDELLANTAALHKHLCPRQVLGVRMGLLGGALLGIAVPQTDKRLLTIAEADGCAADGLATATNCWVGRRTLRIEDYGKVAATFVDTQSGRAVRIWPQLDARERARSFAPEAKSRWESQLLGYQRMPADMLMAWREVALRIDVAEIISRPSLRATCEACGEDILNGREIHRGGRALCKACAGQSYYDVSVDAGSLQLRQHLTRD